MEFDEIDKLMAQRQEEVKKEPSQIGYALVIILSVLIMVVLLWKSHYGYALALGLGLTIGIILRYSRFCFAAAFRDPFITGNTKVLRAVILGLIVSTLGFAAIQYKAGQGTAGDYLRIPGAISPVGIHIMLGAFIFGIGMVLAGGCASGLLMRIGEGHTIHLLVLLGIIIGNLLGAKDYGFWHKLVVKNAKVVYFPDYLDLSLVTLIQLIILAVLYGVALWYEKNHVKQ